MQREGGVTANADLRLRASPVRRKSRCATTTFAVQGSYLPQPAAQRFSFGTLAAVVAAASSHLPSFHLAHLHRRGLAWDQAAE